MRAASRNTHITVKEGTAVSVTDLIETIGIIGGAGHAGLALARTALRAGRQVVIANSRGPAIVGASGGFSRRSSFGGNGP